VLRALFMPAPADEFHVRHVLTAGRCLIVVAWPAASSLKLAARWLHQCTHMFVALEVVVPACESTFAAHEASRLRCGGCNGAPEEKEALRLQIIREAELQHEQELQRLREENKIAQQTIR
jgi:hypothetical protein